MNEYRLKKITFPKMAVVRQKINTIKIADLNLEIEKELNNKNIRKVIKKGDNVGITVGSRGIANIQEIIIKIVDSIKEKQANPFIIPSMGSHGGGTVKGQLEVLESLGIAESSVNAPIIASDKSKLIGYTKKNIPVYVNEVALDNIDKIIIFNRIKSHTEFSGEIESGILKMSAIGLGNPMGAKIVHEAALDLGYEKTITDVGQYIINKLPIAFALVTVENYYHEISHLKIIQPGNIYNEEKKFLKIAKSSIGKIPFNKIDVLIIDEIGKNISGTGMDTKVIGRIMVYGQKEPKLPDIKRIVILDITDDSHGNATGLGLADFTVKRVVDKINRSSTFLNCITAQTPEKGRIPIYFDNDKEAIKASLTSIGYVKPEEARVLHILNTEEVKFIEISESLSKEIKSRKDLEQVSDFKKMNFDKNFKLQSINL